VNPVYAERRPKGTGNHKAVSAPQISQNRSHPISNPTVPCESFETFEQSVWGEMGTGGRSGGRGQGVGKVCLIVIARDFLIFRRR